MQIQSNTSLIAQLDRDAFDFIDAHEKLEAVRKYNLALLKDLKNNKAEQKRLTKKIDDLQDERNDQLEGIIGDRNEKAEMIQKHADEVREQKDKVRTLEKKVDDLTKTKKDYKEKHSKTKTKLEAAEKDVTKYKEDVRKEKEKNKTLKSDLEAANEEIQQERANARTSLDFTDMTHLEEQKDILQAELEKTKKDREKQLREKNKEIDDMKRDRDGRLRERDNVWKRKQKDLQTSLSKKI